jgi:PAS domain S-box-containing protein
VTPPIAGVLAITVGAVVLAGWWLYAPRMPSLVPAAISMVENTAAMCVLAGIALLLHARIARGPRVLARLCAIAIVAIAGLTLFEYGSGIQLGIDEVFARRDALPPSPQTATAFLLYGAAVLLLEREATRRVSEYLAVASGSIALLVLLGYLFGAEALYGMARLKSYIGMAFHTAIVVLLVNLGILAACADRGLLAVVSASDAGGIAARRMLVGLGAIPPIAIAIVLGARFGWYAPEVGSAIVLFVALVEAIGFILLTAAHLSRLDAKARATAAALSASELRVRALVEQASDGIFVADLDGRYTDVNEAGCRMLGYTRDQLLTKSIVDLIEPEEVPRLAAEKAQMLSGAVHISEWKLRRSDGTFAPVEVSAKILPDGRWQGFVRDITEKKAVDQLREEWAAVIAHDLRQPVNTIVLAIDLLDAMHRDQRSEKENRVVGRIRSASRSLYRMIDELLDTSRIAASRMEIAVAEIDLASEVRAVIEALQATSLGSELRVVAEPNLRAWADADRIHQVLGNLVSNALKYGEPGGEIVVEVVRRDLELEVIVTNSGREIAQDELPHLFDRFMRTRDARASKQPGLGLGLYISKGLIEAHGGRMWAESSRGHTSFHFTVPAAMGNAPRARQADAPGAERAL